MNYECLGGEGHQFTLNKQLNFLSKFYDPHNAKFSVISFVCVILIERFLCVLSQTIKFWTVWFKSDQSPTMKKSLYRIR